MQELPKDRKILEMGAIILAAANASEERLLSLARQLPGYRPGISLPTFLYSFLMREYHMSLAEIAGLDDRQIIAFVSDWVAVKAALAPQAESPARPLKQPPRMTTALANAKAICRLLVSSRNHKAW